MEAGKQVGTVIEHRVDASGDKWYVYIKFECAGGDTIPARIYLTDAAMGIARKSLKAIGFDIDAKPLEDIDGEPYILNGNKAELDIEEQEHPPGSGKYSMRVKWVNPLPTAKDTNAMKRMTEKLRAAKKRDLYAEAKEEDIPF